ncbi:Uncharacterized protein HZ326_14383 [Fusarium oxysporum f. sp. albedinis]|nr:Uncharacterized protein HZ326_14383 [Fusarium oxysporum f. sp. albedinis]
MPRRKSSHFKSPFRNMKPNTCQVCLVSKFYYHASAHRSHLFSTSPVNSYLYLSINGLPNPLSPSEYILTSFIIITW